MAVGDLFDLAADLLASVEASVAAAPRGPIARAYVSPGPPAFDCEQVTVHALGVGLADTLPAGPLASGFRETRYGAVNLVTLVVTVIRCVESFTEQGEPPAAADIDADAVAIYGDLWAVWNGTMADVRAGALFTRADGDPVEAFVDGAVPVEASGGFAGWQFFIRVEIDGYAA